LEGIGEALKVPNVQIRWFAKPRSYKERRMGIALATGPDVDEALRKVREAVSKLKVVKCK
jgi:phosphoribosylglycinamide formyltransferase 2